MITKEHIELTAKFYRCHNSAKSLFGVEFPEKIKWYQRLIESVQKKHDLETLPAVLKIMEGENNGMFCLLVMAAAVEIIEPSKIQLRCNSQ